LNQGSAFIGGAGENQIYHRHRLFEEAVMLGPENM
jgi:hypothetical protein